MDYFHDIIIGTFALIGGATVIGAIAYTINEWVQDRYGR